MPTPTAALPVTEQPVTEQPATTPRTMQAIVFDDFGGPEVLVARGRLKAAKRVQRGQACG